MDQRDYINRDPYEDCPAGCEVILPGPQEIQIDVDTEESYLECLERINSLKDCLDFKIIVKDKESKSGHPHHHITIDMGIDLTNWQRVALQAVLGSDPVRERLNAARLFTDNKYPIVFFEPTADYAPSTPKEEIDVEEEIPF